MSRIHETAIHESRVFSSYFNTSLSNFCPIFTRHGLIFALFMCKRPFATLKIFVNSHPSLKNRGPPCLVEVIPLNSSWNTLKRIGLVLTAFDRSVQVKNVYPE